MRKVIAIALLTLAASIGGVWLWSDFSEPDEAQARPGTRHTFMHVNCKHHAHGAAWHKNHGRTLGAKTD